ncbi:hypothetical protein JD77_00556 [Micromonospora olivasterospora]|uniref:Uncharacterized protein n=1 Tax=Micromonospora olivasterospora TaxID=1880 RepID=A0A562I4F4_MICOL|nr:hypothetical protein JD77_00556 [Micromonospora olivasterospora]
MDSRRGLIVPRAASRARRASRPRACRTADIRRVCRTTVAARGRRSRSYATTASGSRDSRSSEASVAASSKARQVPWPRCGGMAWAASPRSTTPPGPAGKPYARGNGRSSRISCWTRSAGSVASSRSPTGVGQPAYQRRSRASWVSGGSGRGAPAAVATQ